MYLLAKIKEYQERYETKTNNPKLNNLLGMLYIEICLLNEYKKRYEELNKKINRNL